MVESLGWVLPIDDHRFRIYVVGRVREAGELRRMRSRLNGKLWEEGLISDDEEYWPAEGEYWADEYEGWR